jgi:hypothetical protein
MQQARILNLLLALVFTLATLAIQVPKVYSRLSDNDREAVVFEAYYALSKTNRDGTSNNTINGKYYGDWNYIASDIKSYELLKSKLRCWSSDWTANGKSPYECGGKNQPTCKYCSAGKEHDFYTNIEGYGFAKNIGRGGQCKFFAHLLLKRAIGEENIPSYNEMEKKSTDIKNVQSGDVIFNKTHNHTAIVVDVKRDKGVLKEITVIESNKSNPKDGLCDNQQWNQQWWSLNGEAIGTRKINNSTEWNQYRVWTGTSYYMLSIGNIKNDKLLEPGCGCSFSIVNDPAHSVFLSNWGYEGNSGKAALMNIDGKDTKLQFVSSTEREIGQGRKKGDRFIEKYIARGIEVQIKYTVIGADDPTCLECEGTDFDAVIAVTKDGRTQRVKASGGCGC